MSEPTPTATVRPAYSTRTKAIVLAALTAAYAFNIVDRTIVSTVGQAIKVDLKITDAELGALGGLSFAVFYTVLGVPIARLAERRSRVSVIAAAMFIWSGFTALCGSANSLVQMMAYRVGVGVGEGGLSPSAHSLISDYFEPRQRASALSIYSFGIPLGAMLGGAVGGWLAKTFGWRATFVWVGLPGVLLALLVRLVVQEPVRISTPPPLAWRTEFAELRAVSKDLLSSWPILNMLLGITVATFSLNGAAQFAPAYFIRAFGLDYATVGLIIGLAGGLSAGVGTLLGGFATDWAGRTSGRWYALLPAIGLFASAPIYAAALSAPDWRAAGGLMLLPGLFAYTYLAPTYAVIQNAVSDRRRATATALMFLLANLVGLGLGPLFVGGLIDHLAQSDFARAIGAAAAQLDFITACPGGVAPAGAPTAQAQACASALASGTRHGVIAAYAFNVWASVHYLIASFGIAAALKARAAATALSAG